MSDLPFGDTWDAYACPTDMLGWHSLPPLLGDVAALVTWRHEAKKKKDGAWGKRRRKEQHTEQYFDERGNLEHEIDLHRGTSTEKRLEYDDEGRLLVFRSWAAVSRYKGYQFFHRFVYEQGRLSRVLHGEDGPVASSYAYDRDGRLKVRTDERGNVARYTYGWVADRIRQEVRDKEGNLLGIRRYAYDGQGRMVCRDVDKFSKGTVSKTSTRGKFAYDAAGRFLSRHEKMKYDDRPFRAIFVEKAEYDAEGRILRRSAATPLWRKINRYVYAGKCLSVVECRGWSEEKRDELEYRVTFDCDPYGNWTHCLQEIGAECVFWLERDITYRDRKRDENTQAPCMYAGTFRHAADQLIFECTSGQLKTGTL